MKIRKFALYIALIALLLLAAGSLLTSSAANAADQASTQLWREVEEATVATGAERRIVPDHYRTVAVDLAALDRILASAPAENPADRTDAVLLALPLPDGTLGRFLIQEYAMMEPELAAKFPEIKTYLGQGVDDPTANVRLDRTPAGFHGMILSAADTVFIDPYQTGDLTHYISYYKRDFNPATKPAMVEMMEFDPDAASRLPDLTGVVLPASGSQLRTYRTVVAATGEYTQYHGGTVAAGMAAIVTTMNRVTGVYERDVAVRMVLVANNDLVVYTNPATDPYTNNNGSTMLGQNQTNLDNVIGSANYDVGHVFSTGGGGVASLGVPCRAGLKARGVTGSSQPVGDPYDIDYVAHELGHQFGANHTFNGTTSSCGGGNRNSSTAYEPGSGSTIMAYAGICGAENLQPNSDAMFHVKSFEEIVAYTTMGQGNTCAAITNTGNTPPTVDAGPDYTIPRQTPFTLTGSASDPDGDTLTYSWEQFNLGTASPPNTDNGTRPIFRAFLPVDSPSRTFPRLYDILNNVSTLGESLPTTNRTLTFRLVARDNRVGGGGVDYDTANVTVTTSAGPFVVTAPNTPVNWTAGSSQSVTWDVANTNVAPVSCLSVNIWLSTDGGNSFQTALATSTPNDGSHSIMVPDVSTTTARIKVECAGNIFFDISNANFTIVSAATATPTATATNTATATSTTAPTATATATATSTTAPTATATATSTTAPTATATATSTAAPTATATNTPQPPNTMHVGDLDGSSSPNGNQWNAYVVVTIHDGGENPVQNATVSGVWSNGATGNGSCVTSSSGQCTIAKTNLRAGAASASFTISNVTHASNSYQPGANHDPDGDSDGTVILVFRDGEPGPTATPTATPTVGAGAVLHVGDLDGSGTPPQGNMWAATVTILVHDSDHNPVVGATVTGSWNVGPGGSMSCVTNVAGLCQISRTLRANIPNATFTVSDVTLAGASYDAGDNHDPDGDSNGTVILVAQP